MDENSSREEIIRQLCLRLVNAELDEIAEAVTEALWPHQWEELCKLVKYDV